VLLASGACLGACAATEREQPAKVQVSPVPSASDARPVDAPTGAVPVPALALEDRHIDWGLNPTMQTLGKMAETLTESVYSHGTRVDERRGSYAFDCSGMAIWVLGKANPKAARSVARGLGGRPLARDFQRRLSRAPTDNPRDGWSRVARVQDAAPGDVLAWLKPTIIDSPNTGHVAFIVLPPQRLPGYDNAFLVRIADSTSLLHDADTRVGRSGFGLGTILLVTNPQTGAPEAYGWVGTRHRVFETAIAIGRPIE
jgi:hypothetical protein